MTGKTKAKIIAATVLGLLGLIIVLQNIQPVETRLLLWRPTMPHVLLLGMIFVAGIILGAGIAVAWCVRQFKDQGES